MDLWYRILAFGLWPALPLTGHYLLRSALHRPRAIPLSRLTIYALISVVGLTVWSSALLGAASAGLYRAEYIGIAGWVVSFLVLRQLVKQYDFVSWLPLRLSLWDWILLAGLAFTAWLYLGFPTESLWGGRDHGVYANHGFYIAHHGRLDVPYPWQKGDEAILAQQYRVGAGLFRTHPTMTVQFAHLLPVWLAHTAATFGPHGLFRLNGVLALISLSTFYGLCRLIVPKPYAVVATLFLALNPGQIWLARITLTEILAQLFVVSGLFVLIQALQDDDSAFARWGGVLLGCSVLTRIDSLLLIPLLFLSHFVLKFVDVPPINKPATVWPALYQGFFPIAALAVGYYIVFSRPYFHALLPQVYQTGAVSLASLAVLAMTTPWVLQQIRPWGTARTVRTLCGILILLLLYAYLVRPQIGPYATFNWSGHPIDGTRDYREDSLVNLARYLSLPIICAAVLGWCVGVYRLVIGKDHLPLAAGLVIIGGFSGVFLWNPSITPDHFWAIRRFIPVVIPGFVLFAAFGMWWVLSKCSPRGAVKLALPVVLFLMVFLIRADAVFFAFAEGKGLFTQLRQLAEKLPRDEIIIAYEPGAWGTWALPLYLTFDRQIVLLDIFAEAGRKTFQQWVAKQAAQQKSVTFVTQGQPVRLCGFAARQVDRIILSQSAIERTVLPLPRRVTHEETALLVYQITHAAEATNYQIVNFATHTVPGVEQVGFSLPERTPIPLYRWTTGHAKLVIPVNHQCPPRILKIELASAGPRGTRLQIVVNGRHLFDQQVPPASWSKNFVLPPLRDQQTVTVEVISDTFVPRDTIEGSTDSRTLGVLVRTLSLLE